MVTCYNTIHITRPPEINSYTPPTLTSSPSASHNMMTLMIKSCTLSPPLPSHSHTHTTTRNQVTLLPLSHPHILTNSITYMMTLMIKSCTFSPPIPSHSHTPSPSHSHPLSHSQPLTSSPFTLSHPLSTPSPLTLSSPYTFPPIPSPMSISYMMTPSDQ